MAPWEAIKSDRDGAAATLRTAINLIRVFALLAVPIIPTSSESVLRALGLADSAPSWPSSDLNVLAAGHAFRVPDVLFRKITDEEIEAWTAQFGGEAEAR